MAEAPNESRKFDVSDLETTAAETPKARKKRAEAKHEPLKIAKPVSTEDSLPGVHEKKTRKRTGKRSADLEAPSGKSEVQEALDMVRETAEESEWDAKIAKAKAALEAPVEVADEDVISAEEEPYAEISIEHAKDDDKELSEDERALAAYREAHPVLTDAEGYRKLGLKQQADEALSKGYEARKKREAKEAAAKEPLAPSGFTEKEEAWFKQGEEDDAKRMAEARATIERGGKAESLVETPDEVDANVRQAEAMIAKGELNPKMFDVNDFRYLLIEKTRLDRELEHAGWWAARKLRAELRETQKSLSDYEKQIGNVHRERHDERQDAAYAALKPGQKKAADRKSSLWSRILGR